MNSEPGASQPLSAMTGSVNATLTRWLARGWRDFRRVPGLSMGYSTGFLAIGMTGTGLLASQGHALMALPLLAGFLLLAPLFALGFYQIAAVLDSGGKPGPIDLTRGFVRAGVGAGAIGFLLVFCYLIWITDALLLYALFFGAQGGLESLSRLQEPTLAGQTFRFLAWSGLTGFVLASGLYLVTVLSLPWVFSRRERFSVAIGHSVRLVYQHPLLLLSWAVVLAMAMFVSLLLLPPLFVVIYPVLAYAGYRGSQEFPAPGNPTT